MRADEEDLLARRARDDDLEDGGELPEELLVDADPRVPIARERSGRVRTKGRAEEWPVSVESGLLGRMDEHSRHLAARGDE